MSRQARSDATGGPVARVEPPHVGWAEPPERSWAHTCGSSPAPASAWASMTRPPGLPAQIPSPRLPARIQSPMLGGRLSACGEHRQGGPVQPSLPSGPGSAVVGLCRVRPAGQEVVR